MASISLTRTTDGTTSNANSNLNNNWTTLENAINGNIDASNLAADSVGASELADGSVAAANLTQMGATTDQALIWTGSAWAPSSVVRPTLVDAKGDLLVGPADNTIARKAAGANETYLVYDSSQSNGFRDQKRVTALSNSTPVGTGASTAEVDLQTVSIPAASLSVGDIVTITAGGTWAGSADVHTTKLYFGSTLLLSNGSLSPVQDWGFFATVLVTGAATQKAFAGAFLSVSATETRDYVTPAQAISGAIIIKTTGQTANAADEVTSEFVAVRVTPA
jgi:hypothetical protein